MSHRIPAPAVTAALILLSVLLAALPMVLPPHFSRPFEQDELVTLGSTSAGMYGTVEELRKRPRFDLKEAAAGFVRPFAGRWDPNYHIVNSWLITVSTFFTGYGEAAVRLPALVAFLASLALLQWLVWRGSGGSWLLMLLSGAVFAALPYSWLFSTSARGYTLLVLMVLLQFALLRPEVWRRVGSNWIFLALSVLNILHFLNMASLLIMWIAPFSLALLLAPAPDAKEVPGGPNATLLRERWQLNYRLHWCQFAALGFVACAIFLLCKLHYFLAAQSRYGLVETSHWRALRELEAAAFWLFPNGAVAVYLLAVTSIIVCLAMKRRFTVLITAALLCAGVCSIYSFITQKVAWERAYGFIIPLAFLLIAELWALVASWRYRASRLLAQGGIALSLVIAFHGALVRTQQEIGLGVTGIQAYSVLGRDLSNLLESGAVPAEPPPFIVKPYSWDVNAYLPTGPESLHRFEPRDGEPAQFLFLLEQPLSLKWLWLRTLTWEQDASLAVNLPMEALGDLEIILLQPLRGVGRKIIVPRAIPLENAEATATAPSTDATGEVIGVLVTAKHQMNREEILEWITAQAPEDYRDARVSIQNYLDLPSTLICWVTPEWPAARWEAVLRGLPAAREAGVLWRLESASSAPPARAALPQVKKTP